MTIPGEPAEVIRRAHHMEAHPAIGAFLPVERRLENAENLERRRAALDGAELLHDLVAFLRRFVVFASVHQTHAIALWVVHTHAIDATDVTPRLNIASPEPRCGKSRVVDLLELLVAAPLVVVNISEAALFRTLAEAPRTLLHDEVDALFKARNEHEDLRALLNAGHSRGRTIPRMVPKGRGFETVEFPCFAATCLAGIGDLPRTLTDRSIPVRLARRLPTEPVERFRRRAVVGEADQLRARVAAWAERNGEHLRDAWPDLPGELDDRAADGWEPLFAIADLAGGEWPGRARAAAVALHGPTGVDDPSVTLQLLTSVQKVFDDRAEPHGLWTKTELLPALRDLEEAPWGAWNEGQGIKVHELARHLRVHGVISRTVRKAERTFKGYLRADLEPVWERYLNRPASPEPTFQPSQRHNPCGTREEGPFQAVTPPPDVTASNGLQPLRDGGCDVVTAKNPEDDTRDGTGRVS